MKKRIKYQRKETISSITNGDLLSKRFSNWLNSMSKRCSYVFWTRKTARLCSILQTKRTSL